MCFEEQKRNLDTYPSIAQDGSEAYATIDPGRATAMHPRGMVSYVAGTAREGRNSVRLPGIDKSVDQN